MHNQDEVALRLTRCTIEEMHNFMLGFGHQPDNLPMPWEELYFLPATTEFLLSHGWTMTEYVEDCRERASKPRGRDFLALYESFARAEFEYD